MRRHVLKPDLRRTWLGFHLGSVNPTAGALPPGALVTMSREVVGEHNRPPLPDWLTGMPDRVVVALSNEDFVSFTMRCGETGLAAIKTVNSNPLTLPNIARNVIAHALGHAVCLDHSSDPRLLMRGRPAPCRPAEFSSAESRISAGFDAAPASVPDKSPRRVVAGSWVSPATIRATRPGGDPSGAASSLAELCLVRPEPPAPLRELSDRGEPSARRAARSRFFPGESRPEKSGPQARRGVHHGPAASSVMAVIPLWCRRLRSWIPCRRLRF
jgi:hypothetical protein